MSANHPEDAWIRCDREMFEVEPELQQFARAPYPGELASVGETEEQREGWTILVTKLAPGVRNRKFIRMPYTLAEQFGGVHHVI